MKKNLLHLIFFAALCLSLFLTSCSRGPSNTEGESESKTLVFYGLFDEESIYQPLIESYESKHPNTTIIYKKFNNPEEYLDLIVNELAEGEGPDIFMLHNTWIPKHYKKLSPAPQQIITPQTFSNSFAEVVSEDLILPSKENQYEVLGLPLYVDTLALFYNQAHFEEVIPEQGKPSTTWEGIKQDAIQLNQQDQSFSRFQRNAIALGRGDNILRAFDTLILLMLQQGVDFYTEDLKTVLLGSSQPALEAFNLFTSFGLPSQENYSWNAYLAEANSAVKEVDNIASGKTSMIMGYSYTYEDIIEAIQRRERFDEDAMDINKLQVQKAPQIDEANPINYASYFALVVSRSSEHPQEAWSFLSFLSSEENLRYYNEKTHKPSPLKTLIQEQSKKPIYGAFSEQIDTAKTLPMSDAEAYERIFIEGIQRAINTESSEAILTDMANAIQALIPNTGIKPIHAISQ